MFTKRAYSTVGNAVFVGRAVDNDTKSVRDITGPFVVLPDGKVSFTDNGVTRISNDTAFESATGELAWLLKDGQGREEGAIALVYPRSFEQPSMVSYTSLGLA